MLMFKYVWVVDEDGFHSNQFDIKYKYKLKNIFIDQFIPTLIYWINLVQYNAILCQCNIMSMKRYVMSVLCYANVLLCQWNDNNICMLRQKIAQENEKNKVHFGKYNKW